MCYLIEMLVSIVLQNTSIELVFLEFLFKIAIYCQ
jgi:hypothetical protein